MVHCDPTFVTKALEMIAQEIPKGSLPTSEMVEKAYSFIELVDKLKAMKAKVHAMEVEAMAAKEILQTMFKGKPSTSKATEAEKILSHLTPQELDHIRDLASQRQSQSSQEEMVAPFSASAGDSEVEVEVISPTTSQVIEIP